MSFYDAIRVGASGAADYEVERSLRFDDEQSSPTRLTRTVQSGGNLKKFTVSFWVKRSQLGNTSYSNSAGNSGQDILHSVGAANRGVIKFTSADKIQFTQGSSSGSAGNISTNTVFRDTNAWYHICVVADYANSTTADRGKIFVNGVRQEVSTTTNFLDANGKLNTNQIHEIGFNEYGQGYTGSSWWSNFFCGYIAEFYFIDGQALDPTSFTETNAATGQLIPKEYIGSFGTTGWYLNFANNDLFTFFKDTSSSARTVTRNGNVIHKSDQTKNGATSIYFDGSGDSLTVPDSSDFHVAGNDFTIEAYIRRTSQGNDEWFLVQSEGTTSNTSIGLHIGSSSSGYANRPSLRYTVGGSGNELQGTTALAANTWYHIAGVRDGNTLRIYVNGVQENSTSFSGTITDASTPVIIGAVNSAGSAGLTGHMDQVRWSNSCRYTGGTSFTPPTTQFTADSNTMLLVQSNVTGDVGSDASGNGNNWTPNGFSVADGVDNDSLADTPTNNFATFNQLSLTGTGRNISKGNLNYQSDSNYSIAAGNFSLKTGKWYWEVTITAAMSGSNGQINGIVRGTHPNGNSYVSYDTNGNVFGIGYVYNGSIQGTSPDGSTNSPGGASGLATFTNNDVLGFATDIPNGTLAFYKNGSLQTTITGLNSHDWFPAVSGYGTSSTNSINFGQREFAHTPPTGHLALNSANLPDPTILFPTQHFNTVTYTGTGSDLAVTGVGFQADWVWIKNRSVGGNWHDLYDSVRGVTKRIFSNINEPEQTQAQGLKVFSSDGFTVGNNSDVGSNGANYVAWNWNGGDTDSATYTVKVVSDSGNKYRFNNFGTSAVTLDLAEGGTYTFDQSDSSMSSHPMKLSTTANGTHGGGSSYNTGVTYQLDGSSVTESAFVSGFSSASSRKLIITVAASAPTLYYYCHYHSGMGGAVNTNSTLGSSNFDGSIQSTVKVNTTAGFSIVLYTGNGTGGATIGHGLGVAPDVLIVKNRGPSARIWLVYQSANTSEPATEYLQLDATAATADDNSAWNDTAPTSTVFSVGTSASSNNNGESHVAYVFSEVAGYSKFGSYIGNGSNDGTFVFTGFKVTWLLIKRTNTTEAWILADTKRNSVTGRESPADAYLLADQANAESTGIEYDMLSNGFKFKTTSQNEGGSTYIYFAFAESPFKNSRAR